MKINCARALGKNLKNNELLQFTFTLKTSFDTFNETSSHEEITFD
jgi:hypothetical protein